MLDNPKAEVKVNLKDGEGNIKTSNTLLISLQSSFRAVCDSLVSPFSGAAPLQAAPAFYSLIVIDEAALNGLLCLTEKNGIVSGLPDYIITRHRDPNTQKIND